MPFWNPELRILLQLPRFVVQILTLGPQLLFCGFFFLPEELSINASPFPQPQTIKTLTQTGKPLHYEHGNHRVSGRAVELSQSLLKAGPVIRRNGTDASPQLKVPRIETQVNWNSPWRPTTTFSEMFSVTPQSHRHLSWESYSLNGSSSSTRISKQETNLGLRLSTSW